MDINFDVDYFECEHCEQVGDDRICGFDNKGNMCVVDYSRLSTDEVDLDYCPMTNKLPDFCKSNCKQNSNFAEFLSCASSSKDEFKRYLDYCKQNVGRDME